MALHRSKIFKAAGCVLLVFATELMTTAARGATYTFVQNGTAWNGSANWVVGDQASVPLVDDGVAGVPNAIGDIAILQQKVSTTTNATFNINLATFSPTIGILRVRNTDNTYTTALTGNTTTPPTITFSNGASVAELIEEDSAGDQVADDASRLRIVVPVQLNSSLKVTQTHNLNKNTATEFANKLSGADSITITKVGAGSLQMGYVGSTSGFFFGDVDVQVGLLRIINPGTNPNDNNYMLSQSKGVYIHDGAQIQIGNSLTSWGLGSNAANTDIGGKAELVLEGVGDTSNPSAPLPDGALRFDHNGANALTCDVTSPIKLKSTVDHASPRIYVDLAYITGRLMDVVRGDGSAGLIKGGNGVLKLMNANGNTYAGSTNISKGTLVVNNTNSATSGVGTGALLVNDTGSGSNLAGTGFIGTAANPVNVTLTGDLSSSTRARLYPGDLVGKNSTVSSPGTLSTSIGALTIHGNLSFDALSSLNIDLSHSAADQVIVDGSISLGGAGLNFTIGTPDLDGTESFTLIDNLANGSVAGIFGSLNGVAGDYSEGMPVLLGSQTYHISYTGGTGNDVVLSGTPAGVDGDYNNDGVVNAGDYVLWRKGGPLANQVDDPMVVNAQDYTEWRARFGNPNAGSGSSLGLAAVPEPATIILLALISPFFAPLVARRKLGRTRS